MVPCARTIRTSPISPRRISSSAATGEARKRCCEQTASTRPLPSTSAIILSASATLWAIGFSTSTCLPARPAAVTYSSCESGCVATTTRSMSGRVRGGPRAGLLRGAVIRRRAVPARRSAGDRHDQRLVDVVGRDLGPRPAHEAGPDHADSDCHGPSPGGLVARKAAGCRPCRAATRFRRSGLRAARVPGGGPFGPNLGRPCPASTWRTGWRQAALGTRSWAVAR